MSLPFTLKSSSFCVRADQFSLSVSAFFFLPLFRKDVLVGYGVLYFQGWGAAPWRRACLAHRRLWGPAQHYTHRNTTKQNSNWHSFLLNPQHLRCTAPLSSVHLMRNLHWFKLLSPCAIIAPKCNLPLFSALFFRPFLFVLSVDDDYYSGSKVLALSSISSSHCEVITVFAFQIFYFSVLKCLLDFVSYHLFCASENSLSLSPFLSPPSFPFPSLSSPLLTPTPFLTVLRIELSKCMNTLGQHSTPDLHPRPF